ncbi:MAG: hypothetical protein WC091_12265 [Sulfuricellaceae bacterium]
MKKYSMCVALLALLQYSAVTLADQIVTSADPLQIIQARIKERLAGNIGNYKQIWGDSNPLIDNLIKKSKADNPSTLLESIANAKNTNSFASATKTCIDNMGMANNGAYYNAIRECTTTHADRNYMHNVVYPSINATMMASVYSPAVEIGTFPPDFVFMTFYDPSGYASEFLSIFNATY